MSRHAPPPIKGPLRLDEETSYKRRDLITCSPHDWCEVLALAAKIGVTDAMVGNATRTGTELARALATEYRNGHARALKQAYSAGRFHVDVMGKP